MEECVARCRVVVLTVAVLPSAAVERAFKRIQQPLKRKTLVLHNPTWGFSTSVISPSYPPVSIHLREVVCLTAPQGHVLLGEVSLHFCTINLKTKDIRLEKVVRWVMMSERDRSHIHTPAVCGTWLWDSTRHLSSHPVSSGPLCRKWTIDLGEEIWRYWETWTWTSFIFETPLSLFHKLFKMMVR